MKTPHRLIHDAKEAGVITEAEWQAFMRARNEADKFVFDEFNKAKDSAEALDFAFEWSDTKEGSEYWCEVCIKLDEYEGNIGVIYKRSNNES